MRLRPEPGCRHPRIGLLTGDHIADHLLEHRQILQVAFAPIRSDAAEGMRTVAVDILGDFDQLRGPQHLQMAAEVAIGQRAHGLQVRECQALRVRDQAR